MSDASKIPPALTAEEWARGIPGVYGWDDGSVFVDWRSGTADVERPEAVIAAINASLPDSDPRKITREWVRTLRGVASRIEATDGMPDEPPDLDAVALDAIADALESYLPPA